MKTKLQVIIFIYSTIATATCYGLDLEREKRLSEQAMSTLFIGEAIELSTARGSFLALTAEPDIDSKGAVILLHGRGYGADAEVVVAPLREAFAENGWHTLSLQMPVLGKGKEYYDYLETFPEARQRINSGIEYLVESGISPIILLAHSCGSHMAMDRIREFGDKDIKAFVGLAMGGTDLGQPMKQPFPIDKMSVPILDIYGSEDYPGVLANAKIRKSLVEKTHTLSKQIVLADANHEFVDQNEPMIEEVVQWLDQVVAE